MALSTSPRYATGYTKTDRKSPNYPPFIRALPVTLLLLVVSLLPTQTVFASPFADKDIPTPAQVIEAVNELRTNNGLYPLSVHSVLMQVAQTEANGIANGNAGHWRPNGLTLGQWLISMGYPLSGDLSLDGYRSENWVAASTALEAIQAWKGDAEHTNTMLSPDRSDIGVGIAVSDQIYVVLITALQTSSGNMQSAAYPLLTQAASSKSGASQGFQMSQYINPVVLSTARPDGDVVHRIKYGQSLWGIAVAYHTTIDQIRAWNNLGQDTTVYEGQYLLVQRSATLPPPTPFTPLATSTPRVTATPQPAIPSPTATALPPSSNQAGDAVSHDTSVGTRIGLMLLVVIVGGLIGVWLLRWTH